MKNYFKIALLASLMNINISYGVNIFEEEKKDLTNLTSQIEKINIQKDDSSSLVNQPTTHFENNLTSNLPVEIISHVTSYLNYTDAKLHQTNRYFFISLTGYPLSEIKHVGLESLSTISSRPTFSMIRDLKIRPFGKTIPNYLMPSYLWYSFVGKVLGLAKNNWSYLHKTHIQEFILMNYSKPKSYNINEMKENMFFDLMKVLPETQIHTIRFYGCIININEICEFIESLRNTKVHTLDLTGNKPPFLNNDIMRFVKAFTGTPVQTIYLTSIENSAALILGKECFRTSLKNIYFDYGIPEYSNKKVHYFKSTISQLTSENPDIKFYF